MFNGEIMKVSGYNQEGDDDAPTPLLSNIVLEVLARK